MASVVGELKRKTYLIKKQLIDLCAKESIHIGGALSAADFMTALWQYALKYDVNDPDYEYRDRFVLSKGHVGELLFLEQAMRGCYPSQDVLDTYAKDETKFAMHGCNMSNRFVEISTGSLGHGLPVACGIAQGLKLKGNAVSRVFTVAGDGEQSEGSIWEAALGAVKHRLGNLVLFVDNNNLEADGSIDEVTALDDISAKYKTFGWNVVDIDGNDMDEIVKTLDALPSPDSSVPTAIICHTVKGKGVSFMENNPRWHAGKLSAEQYAIAACDVEKEYEENIR